jgi:hypothetical protein
MQRLRADRHGDMRSRDMAGRDLGGRPLSMIGVFLAALLLCGCQAMTLDPSSISIRQILDHRPIEFEVTLIRIPF